MKTQHHHMARWKRQDAGVVGDDCDADQNLVFCPGTARATLGYRSLAGLPGGVGAAHHHEQGHCTAAVVLIKNLASKRRVSEEMVLWRGLWDSKVRGDRRGCQEDIVRGGARGENAEIGRFWPVGYAAIERV